MKHLIVKSKEFQRLEIAFKEWLKLLGYSHDISENIPIRIREFFYFLESKDIRNIKSIKEKDHKDFFEMLSTRKNVRRGGSLSNRHLNKYIYSLNLFSQYLQKAHNIYLKINLQSEKIEKEIKTVLTKKEVDLLLQEITYDPVGLRDRAMLAVYYGCGLRLNEGINLEVDDILFNKGLLYVRKGKNYQERYVPMNEKVIIFLRDYINYGRQALLKGKKNNLESRYLFVSFRGEKIQGQTLYKRLKELQKRTNNTELMKKEIGIHTLRHSIATHLLQKGMSLESIKEFLGHKSIESTQIYTHLMNEL